MAHSDDIMSVEEIIAELKTMARPGAIEGMARYGIKTEFAIGVSMPNLRKTAKAIGKHRKLAAELWESGIHDCRILASLVDIPAEVTKSQMNKWAKDFNSWDVCDQCCMNLFSYSPFAWEKAVEWAGNTHEFTKRAAFALQASLAVHEKKAPDEKFLPFFPLIEREATDDRNFVKKAVNWSLRQMGKRSVFLHKHAMETAERLAESDSKAARWIAKDALRELEGESVAKRLGL